MMRRSVVDAILSLTESIAFRRDSLPGWVLKPTIWTIQMPKGRLVRPVGVLGNFFSTLLKGLLIFQIFPLIIAFVAGLLSCFISLLMTFFVVVRTLILGNPTSGWTSLMAVILFLGGIQLLTIGILGKYISKIYLETKKRPLYLVKEKVMIG